MKKLIFVAGASVCYSMQSEELVGRLDVSEGEPSDSGLHEVNEEECWLPLGWSSKIRA